MIVALTVVLIVLIGIGAHRLNVPAARSLTALPTHHSPRSDHASLLERLAGDVRTGTSLVNGFLDHGDSSTAFIDATAQLRNGASLCQALAAVDLSDADTALTVQAITAAAALGGPVAATLDEAAAVLRERLAGRAERRAHSAQARLSARVLTVVPLGFAAWSAVSSQRTRDAYLSSSAGAACACAGLVLNIAGWRWMRRIVGVP
jgi:hypothetical protein